MGGNRKAVVEKTTKIDTFVTVYNITVAHAHNYYVGNVRVLVHNTNCEKAAEAAAKGGVYVLKDGNKVVRTGRTIDLIRREAEHNADKLLKHLKFDVRHYSDNYEVQRGLEHLLFEDAENAGAKAINGGFNKIRAMSEKVLNSAKGQGYIKAANDFLKL